MTNVIWGSGAPARRRARWVALVAAATLIVTAFIAFQAPARATAASPCGPDINAIVCENQKPGTSPAEWDVEGAGDPSIQGFATDISVNAGQRIDFKIDTDASKYSIRIYRTGWYQGLGARYITTVQPSVTLPQNQPECKDDEVTEIYDCGTWAVSASWNVPADAVSGVYVARLIREDTGGDSHIIFIVRKDGNTSDVLFQTSDPTWHAYNKYGGSNFYQGAANGRAYKVSYNRPFATRGGIEARDFYFSSEYATVRFLERNGYDMSYIAGVDTDRRGHELLNHKVFLSVGHDEYWSGAQRANIEAARDAGVNLQFLTGNEGYWRTRYEPSVDGSNTAYRTLVSYKETWGDWWTRGGAKIDTTSPEWTGTWRDPRFAGPAQGGTLPENALMGTMYMVNHVDLPVTVSAEEGKYRLWRHTGLGDAPSGTTTKLAAHTVGYESNEVVDNGYTPGGLIRLSTTTGPTAEYLVDYGNTVVPGNTRHHVTLYRAPSGALVFSAASVQWGWGLDATHDGNGAPADPRMQQAQVNLLADMGAQPGSLMSGLVAATKSTDVTAPTTTITSHQAGATIANGARVTLAGTASDVGGRVAGVEVSTDDGRTWRAATGTNTWTYSYVQQGSGAMSVRVRAIDDSANTDPQGTVLPVTVTGPYSAFGETVPAIASANDTQAVELGLRFTPESDGFVAGVRFYKGAANTGTHTGSLWDAAGNRLATVQFGNETAQGWQTAQFLQPVEVFAGQQYTVSYTAPNGGYAIQTRYWPYQARWSSPVTTSSEVGAKAAGVFGAPGTRPTSTSQESNYFVDVVFTGSDTSPLRISARSPEAGMTSVGLQEPVTATFTRAADPASVSITVTAQGGGAVNGVVSYDAATRTARFAPATAYAPSTTYDVAIQATDAQGVALAADSGWRFTTQAQDLPEGTCPCSLFSESRRPAIASDADTSRVTLGVGFTSSLEGSVTALKFYKSAANNGPHVGTLWDPTGREAATVTFPAGATSGWQVAQLDTPVTVKPGERWVVSYVAPTGRYSVTPGTFSSTYTRGPLTVAAGGAVYTYGSGQPTQSSTTDYGVDLVFETAPAAPTVVEQTPSPGATGVAATVRPKVRFSAPIAGDFTGTVTADGAAVAGTWSTGDGSTSATFTPTANFPAGAQVVVRLTGLKGADGVPAADVEWSFRIAGATEPTTLLGNATPAATEPGSWSVELGMAFQTSVPGEVTAIRFYKAVGNGGTHTGSLWDAAGRRIAQVTFAGETASGWQRAPLSSPVDLVPGEVYTVSYYAPQGKYSYTSRGFASPVTSGPLTAIAPQNGRYVYGTGGVAPTEVWNSTNYFVDVEFQASDGGSTPALAVEATAPQRDATAVATDATVTATLNRDPAPQQATLALAGPSGAVAGSSAYDAQARRVSFDPNASLAAATRYTATVLVDGLALDSWSFTTAEPPASSNVQTLFGTSTPAVASVTDRVPVELGTVFEVGKTGMVTALRFYKGPGNDGPHRGTLWGPDGARMAEVQFAPTSGTGWQRAALSQRVEVKPGQTYIVSYFSPGGGYSYTRGYFSTAKVSGDITGPAVSNGRFFYGPNGGRPVDSWNASAYFVDVEIDFGTASSATAAPPATATPTPTPTATATPTPTATATPTPTPTATATPTPTPTPTPVGLSSVSPARNAVDVAPTTTVAATFAEDQPAAAIAVAGPSGAVPGTIEYEPTTRTVTFTPTEPLAWSAEYRVTVTVPDREVTDGTWSFTTAAEPATLTAETIFGDAVPQNAAWNDPNGVQVATRFFVDVAGEATGVRFYKGTANTGEHTGYLWRDGQKLAEVLFLGENAEGWQTARFNTPVALEPGVEYRVGLYSTTGRYAVDLGTLAQETTVGHFRLPANGSAFTYSRGFPDTVATHNYWVDILFTPQN